MSKDALIKGSIIYNDISYDKDDIISKSNKMYNLLCKNNNITNETRILVALPRTEKLLVADIMAFKYCITFINIDLSMPFERIRYIIEDAKVDFILTNKENEKIFEQYSTVCVDDYEEESSALKSAQCNENEVAYILYTSGTTGKPKGVEVYRKGLLNFCDAMEAVIDFSRVGKIACFTNQTFDIFFLETIFSLLYGLNIVLADETVMKNPKLMIDLVDRYNIDSLQLTPSRIRMMSLVDKELTFLKNVKVLMIGGEKFPEELLEEMLKYDAIDIYNMYGPTETTIWSTVSKIEKGIKQVDIGKPILNTTVFIIDGDLKEKENGEIGEIAIGGSGIAKGYVNNEILTKEKFITLENGEYVYRTGDLGKISENGNIECFGRTDTQIKINGYRVELDEIDAVLNKSGMVESTCTCFDEKKNTIITYYVEKTEVKLGELRKYLSEYLPTYMLPQSYVKVDELEYTYSGKIDKKALLEKYKNAQATDMSEEDDNQEELINIIKEAVKDNQDITKETVLADLGIDSITFISLIIEIEDRYDIEFDDEKMMIEQYKTIGDLIIYIKESIDNN